MGTKLLVTLFLRGGADGLSIVAPSRDQDYIAGRPGPLRVEPPPKRSRLWLAEPLADVGFCFHPRAAPLAELYADGHLAVVHAAGLIDPTRSHFDAEERMERAAPGQGARLGGWLARWLAQAKPGGFLPAFAIGDSVPESLRGAERVAAAPALSGLRLAPGHGYAASLRSALGRSFPPGFPLAGPLDHALTLSREIEARVGVDEHGALKPYTPRAEYPPGSNLAQALQSLVQALELDLGLRVATLDFGGFDTHVNQAGSLPPLIEELSASLAAFWQDLGPRRSDVTVVVMSEFGGRLKANQSGGTDHGHGNLLLVLGAALRGGRMYGRWPTLANAALDAGADLAITTDYRHVLAEVLQRTLGCPDPAGIFPGFSPQPLGLWS
jgi:uncharacterized protein (DUF1501 family)